LVLVATSSPSPSPSPVQGSVWALFRGSLGAQGFLEIQTPKLVAGESEGGADVFRTDYFGVAAKGCLNPGRRTLS